MISTKLSALTLAASMTLLIGNALAHSGDSPAGTPVCLEGNYMMADAMNAPFSNIPGAGRVIEMNTLTGERGITVESPFRDPAIAPLCPGHVSCPGPFKPTGIVSGGENGHAYLVSAAQHALIEHHRDGTAIRTSPLWPTSPSPNGGNFGWVPRLLGNGFMPNGNIAQTVCDANFFNAGNSDHIKPGEPDPAGDGNSSNLYFPPVYGTEARSYNGRVVVIDQTTLKLVDEYSKPTKGPYANDPRWNCPAGVVVTSEGLFVSMFHGNAVFVIDWKAGIDEEQSAGVGSNDPEDFKLGKKKNEAKVIRVIDLLDTTGNGAPDAPQYDSPFRRDNLRAIRMAEDGTLFGTNRGRSRGCVRGEAPGTGNPNPCTPAVFRQHIFVAAPGSNHKTGTIALDPGVNVIAGTSINRISGPGCAFVQQEVVNNGGTLTGDECDVETVTFAVSAGNAGCDSGAPGHPANRCFTPSGAAGGGGTVYEYRIDAAHLDGGALAGDGSGNCDGDPSQGAASFQPGGSNAGCALPIAEFKLVSDGLTSDLPAGQVETIDPRMLMHIHEAFNQ